MKKSLIGLAAALAIGALAFDLPPTQPPRLAFDLPPTQPPRLA